jgi:hypothetical protein
MRRKARRDTGGWTKRHAMRENARHGKAPEAGYIVLVMCTGRGHDLVSVGCATIPKSQIF